MYISTRDGVDLLRPERGSESTIEKQREYILRIVKTFPSSKELAEYEDYLSMHTKDAASDFIDHQKVKTSADPFLDREYFEKLTREREIENVTAPYKAVWMRQQGNCYYCGRPI